MNILDKSNKIHFIGIGGIGMSALARHLLASGKVVFGSDASESPVVAGLRQEGVEIVIGHRTENIAKDVGLVVYTPAIAPDNIELVEARRRNIPALTYPEALGEATRNSYTIAVCGTHGKTTTTGMAAAAMKGAGLSPSVVVGSLLNGPGTNYIKGDGEYFLIEACEYRRAFLNYNPKIVIITNVDYDHLDYYKDLADIQLAFRQFAEKIPEDGALICDVKNERLSSVVRGLKCRVVDYMDFLPAARALSLKVPGEHNRLNATCVLALASVLGADTKQAEAGLASFAGTWRRIEHKGETVAGGAVYDDYGHNPTEVATTLRALRGMHPKKKIVVLFQPHLYSRTKMMKDDFAKSFSDADEVVVLPIYAARELPDPETSNRILSDAIAEIGTISRAAGSFEEAAAYVKSIDNENLVVVTQGAGDVYKISSLIVE